MIIRTVESWMTSPVVTVSPETRLSDARRIMDAEHIRALPILKNNDLVGIITKRGLLRVDLSTLDQAGWKSDVDLYDEKVGEVMTSNPITVAPESFVPKAARIMMENKITALPVTSERRLIGILTNSDILRFILADLPTLKKKLYVRDYMTDEVVTIDRDTSLLEAHRVMGVKRIRSLPVMEEETLVGLVTRTDLMSNDPSRLLSCKNQEASLKILTQSVEKVMTRKIITVTPEATLDTAARSMLDHKIHCLPVLDKEKRLVGIITEIDLFLMAVQKFF